MVAEIFRVTLDLKVLWAALAEACAHHLWDPRLHAKPRLSLRNESLLPSSICCPKPFSIPQLSSHHLSPGADSAAPAPLASRLFAGKRVPLLCFFGPNFFFFFASFLPPRGDSYFITYNKKCWACCAGKTFAKGQGVHRKQLEIDKGCKVAL